MLTLKLPLEPAYLTPAPDEVLFVTNADLRESANVECWPVEAKYETLLETALAGLGKRARRAHPIKADKGHGFISSQREGSDIFATIDPDAPVIVCEGEKAADAAGRLFPGWIATTAMALTVVAMLATL